MPQILYPHHEASGLLVHKKNFKICRFTNKDEEWIRRVHKGLVLVMKSIVETVIERKLISGKLSQRLNHQEPLENGAMKERLHLH